MSDAAREESLSDDDALLATLGYKQELSRSWSSFSNFAISFSIISILAGCFTSFGLGWNNGGPAAIAWGWPIISVFILPTTSFQLIFHYRWRMFIASRSIANIAA